MNGTVRRLVAIGCAALLLLLGVPAYADDDVPLEFSADGHTWSAAIPDVFADEYLVPGTRLPGELWVRQDSGGAARVEVQMADPGAASGLGQWVHVSVDGTPVAPGERWTAPRVESGEPLRLEVGVELSAAAPLSVRDVRGPTIARIVVGGIGAQPVRGERDLPRTGAAGWRSVVLAGALIAGGGGCYLGQWRRTGSLAE